MPNDRLLDVVKVDVQQAWEEYADSFNEPTKEKAWAKEGIWRLVGNGKVTDATCGNFRGFTGCVNAEGHNHTAMDGDQLINFDGLGFIRLKHKSCYSYHCPVCYLSWAVRAAHDITDRLESLGSRFGLADHIVLSLPDECFDPELGLRPYFSASDLDFDKLLIKVVKSLRKRGIVGGTIIFHGFRYADKQEAEQKNVAFGWRWSPHFHILGFIRNKKQFYDKIPENFVKDGFVVNLKSKRISVFGTAWYQLNHASVIYEKKHFEVARWFGDVIDQRTIKMRENSKKIKLLKKDSSFEAGKEILQLQEQNRNLKTELKQVLHKEHKQKCPICQRNLVELEYFGVRKDLKKHLLQCSKPSDKRFFDQIIDSVNQTLNWAEK